MSFFFEKKIISNFFSLITLQGLNYALPIVTIPILISSLEVTQFGNWTFVAAIVSFFRTIVNYGFDLTATPLVATNRNNNAYINKTYTSIAATRIFLFFTSLLLVALSSIASEKINDLLLIINIAMLALIGEALFPTWLYQGMEDMAIITKIKVLFKILSLLLIYLIIKTPNDLYLVFAIDALISFLTAVTAYYHIKKKYKFKYIAIKWLDIKEQLHLGFHITLSFLTVHLYTTINVIVLGLYIDPILVGFYAVSEKIYFAIRGIIGVFVQAIFPRLSIIYNDKNIDFSLIFKKIFLLFLTLLLVTSISLYSMAEFVISIITGNATTEMVETLQILAISLVFAVGTLLSPLLVIQKKNKTIFNITITNAVINLIIIIPLINHYSIQGAAYALIITQAIQAIMQIIYARKLLFSSIK